MKRILIIGASGYVGAYLYKILSEKYEVFGTSYRNSLDEKYHYLDITNEDAVEIFIKKYQPHMIIHASARAEIRWCEDNPIEAAKINFFGIQHVGRMAEKNSIYLFFISSILAECEHGVYAKTKRDAEHFVMRLSSPWVIIRPSWILGLSPNTESPRPFNRLLQQIKQNKPLVYDTSWEIQPTFLQHLGEVVVGIIEQNIHNEIIGVFVEKISSRYETVRDVASHFGLAVLPCNENVSRRSVIGSLDILRKYKLPECSYDKFINELIAQIQSQL